MAEEGLPWAAFFFFFWSWKHKMIYEVLLILLNKKLLGVRSMWHWWSLCLKAAPVSIPICPFLSPLIEYLIMGMRSLSNWTWLLTSALLNAYLALPNLLILCLDKKKKEELRSLRMTTSLPQTVPLAILQADHSVKIISEDRVSPSDHTMEKGAEPAPCLDESPKVFLHFLL